MKRLFYILCWCAACCTVAAQGRKTENLVIVTLDGLRWQEVFGGADSVLVNSTTYTRDTAGTKNRFWSSDAAERRKKLFPFIWNTIAQQGQIYGNRNLGNLVNNANPYWFSYPGYNEIFTGYPDTAINSNDKVYNKNINVLEFINQQPGYKGNVAAFATWDVFPFILNNRRSGIYVNAGTDTLPAGPPQFAVINDLQRLAAQPIDVRLDVLTYMAAREYLKASKPKVLYIAFDETDDYAHGGQYDQYLKSAHAEDNMIKDLWNTLQSMPQYKDKTTLILATDHGRGDQNKDQWRDHGQKVADASQIWMAVMGPDTQPLGEVTKAAQWYQRQLATTMAALLGFTYQPAHAVMPPVSSMLAGK